MADWDLPHDPLLALREGDPGPFEGFVRSHARLLFTFFRRLGAGSHRAEDLTQETFLKLHENAHRYRPQERFAAYCYRVARNVWIDHRRREGARPAGVPMDAEGRPEALRTDGRPHAVREGGGPGPAPMPDPLEHTSLDEEDRRLRTAITRLGEAHRTVFEMAVTDELAYSEIASLLDIPVGTVKSRMYHAVRKLRAALEEDSSQAHAPREREEGS